jgi:hypothetical protein
MDLVRTAALGRVRQPLRAAAAVALAEATATTGEIPQVPWRDLDFAAGVVRLPGAPPVRPREVGLTQWGASVLARLEATTDAPDDAPVLTSRAAPTSAQAAAANLLAKVLRSAGLHDPRVRPTSIRLYGASLILAGEGIEAAARALGVDSLDAAAAALGHDWQRRR